MESGSGPAPSQSEVRPRAHRYCPHDGAREIRMYMAYAEANAVRLRVMLVSQPGWRHVSAVYEIPNGWAWTLCNECPADEARAAAEE